MAVDYLIPIVFPDYRIRVETPRVRVSILPGARWDDFDVPSYRDRWSDLGHAGALLVKGATGLTRYYEYGRYDPPRNLGLVRNRPISNARAPHGVLALESLKAPLRHISLTAGEGTRISGALIETNTAFDKMDAYAKERMRKNADPKRRPYALLGNNCMHFVFDLAQAAGADLPWMLDPRPVSYVSELRDKFPDLDYARSTDKLTIENKGVY